MCLLSPRSFCSLKGLQVQFVFYLEMKTKLNYWFKYRRRSMAVHCTMIVGVMTICIYGYITTALNQTSVTLNELDKFHQYYLKGQFVYIPGDITKDSFPQTSFKPQPKPRDKRSLCHTFIGRLGNKMFQYSVLYSIATANGLKMVSSYNLKLSNIFSNLPNISTDFKPCLQYTKLFERDVYRFELAITKLRSDTNYLLEGFLQSWKYFKPFENDLRYQFTFRDHIKKRAEYSLQSVLQSYRHYKQIKNPFETFIGIHVRRGDYAKYFPPNKTSVINLPTSSYFERAKDYFRTLYPSPVFVVCSDDIDWCENNIRPEETVFIRGNEPEVDLAILGSLNHTITSFGTFTFWAAWLANGTTLYPKNIVDDRFGKRKDIFLHDHVYHTWIPI